ncbi:MAG: FtsQ-type POTRA domain-containing protein [Rickettsiales bacterium]|nr:FtsQ-type POTRA domain-containing protein [Rickettsiales bacterium]
MAEAVVVGRAAAQNKHAMKWQQESAEINRLKAKSLWWYSLKRRIFVISGLVILLTGVATAWWVHQSGQFSKSFQSVNDWAYGVTKSMGFELNTIRVEGLEKLSVEYVGDAMGAPLGSPILQLSVAEIKANLEALPEVRKARVERVLPDKLQVVLTERTPHAIWQFKGEHTLIDIDGTVLRNQHRDTNKRYMVLVGEDVPDHTQMFIHLMQMTPELAEEVEAAVRVGGRRWDVHLRQGMIVKLPQEDYEIAWQKMYRLATERDILSKGIEIVDMRIAGKIYMTLDSSSKESLEQSLTSAHQI